MVSLTVRKATMTAGGHESSVKSCRAEHRRCDEALSVDSGRDGVDDRQDI